MEVQPDKVRARVEAACWPARVLLHVTRTDAKSVVDSMTSLGYALDPAYDLLLGSVADVAHNIAKLCANVPAGPFNVISLGQHTPATSVVQLQALQHANGITPIPGWILRGADGLTRTYVLTDGQGTVQGGISMQKMSFRGSPAAMGFGLCIATSSAGRGWARYLNARAIRDAAGWEASWFMEIVSPRLFASQRANQACGLRVDDDACFLFAEALLSTGRRLDS